MNGKKTYLVVCLMIIHALAAYALGHDVTLNLQEIFGALGLAALRHGVAKGERQESLGPGVLRSLFLCALCVLCVSQARAAQQPTSFANWDTWSWEAPNPPLPDTEWYNYGWDSTSNGPVPAELLEQRAALRAPGRRQDAGGPSPLRMARNEAPPPLPPQPGTRNPEPGAAATAAPKELAKVTLTYAETKPGRFYADSGLTLSTANFEDSKYGYGLRLGYQVSKHWGLDVGVGHAGLDVTGSAIQDISFRAVARLPFELFSPYTFLGGRFDLERDRWTIEPGAGIELGADKLLRGLSIYAEGKLKATTDGRNSYGFETGVRLRF